MNAELVTWRRTSEYGPGSQIRMTRGVTEFGDGPHATNVTQAFPDQIVGPTVKLVELASIAYELDEVRPDLAVRMRALLGLSS